MLKFFRLPFASAGDKTAVPDAADSNGSVSYSQGYGFDYQRQKTDPAAKNIERDKMNQVFFDMTTAIAEIQSQGVPDFITSALNGGSAYSYGQNALVRYSGAVYISLAAANTAAPTDATKWALLATPAMLQQAANNTVVAGGTVDALTGAFTPTIAALPASPRSLFLLVRTLGTNTATVPTFAADATAAKAIVKGNNVALVAGDMPLWAILQYDSTLDKYVLHNPVYGVAPAGATSANLQNQTFTAFTTGGTTGAFTLTPSPALGAYAANQRFRVKFNAIGNGTDTLNVSGLGAKNIKQYDSNGTKVAPVIASGALHDLEYDGTDFVILGPLSRGLRSNGQIGISANTTLGQTQDGGNIVVTSPCTLTFPSTTATYVIQNVSGGAVTFVFPVGSDFRTSLASGESVILCGDGSGYWRSYGGSSSVGVGQTWQDVTASRALTTTYTNTTGRPIAVAVMTGGNTTSTLTIGGVAAAKNAFTVTGTNINLFGIVPPGATYSVTSGASLIAWSELR